MKRLALSQRERLVLWMGRSDQPGMIGDAVHKPSHYSRKRSVARLYAVQALFQMEASGQSSDTVIQEFLSYRIGERINDYEMMKGDVQLFSKLVEDAVNLQALIDQMTERTLVEKWPISRIDPTVRNLFRAAGAEFMRGDTPPKVVIDEFVDVARAFFPEGPEPKLVNAVLDRMAREFHPKDF